MVTLSPTCNIAITLPFGDERTLTVSAVTRAVNAVGTGEGMAEGEGLGGGRVAMATMGGAVVDVGVTS